MTFSPTKKVRVFIYFLFILEIQRESELAHDGACSHFHIYGKP